MTKSSLADQLESTDMETLREIIRNSESYLSAQLTSAIAADQRALAMSGYLSAAVVVLVGGAAGLALASEPNYLLSAVTFCTAAILFLALNLAIKSARPSNFEFPGNIASSWSQDIAEGKPLSRSLAEQCEHYDGMALANNELMQKNAKSLGYATRTAFYGLCAGGLGFGAVVFWFAICGAR